MLNVYNFVYCKTHFSWVNIFNLKQYSFTYSKLLFYAKLFIYFFQPELYKKELIRQSSADSSGIEYEYNGKLHFAIRYDPDVEGLVVKVRPFYIMLSFLLQTITNLWALFALCGSLFLLHAVYRYVLTF